MQRHGFKLHLTNVEGETWRATFSGSSNIGAEGCGTGRPPTRVVPIAAVARRGDREPKASPVEDGDEHYVPRCLMAAHDQQRWEDSHETRSPDTWSAVDNDAHGRAGRCAGPGGSERERVADLRHQRSCR